MAGLVTLPNPHYVALSQIEFIALSENRALAIMVMNNREVQNRGGAARSLLFERGAAAAPPII